MSVPILTLLIMTGIQLSTAVDGFARSRKAGLSLESDIMIGKVIEKLQIERGMTAVYLGRNRTSEDAKRRLLVSREETFQIMVDAATWPNDEHDKFLSSKSEAYTALISYRQQIDNGAVDIWASTEIYTSMSRSLIDWIILQQALPEDKVLSYYLDSAHSQLMSLEIISLQRAFGSTMYTMCSLPYDKLLYFIQTFGEESSLREISYGRQDIRDIFDTIMNQFPGLEGAINNLHRDIFSQQNLHNECNPSKRMERQEKALLYFNTFTNFMDALTLVRQETINRINSMIFQLNEKWKFELIVYGISMSLVVMIGISSSTAFVINVNSLMSEIKEYAETSLKRSHAYQSEEKKVEKLLCQMLPKVVAEKLKSNRTVQNEYFNSVTIYFSDIVGFIDMGMRSSPHQIVDLLNTLYR